MYKLTLIGESTKQIIDDVSDITLNEEHLKIKLSEWREEDSFYLNCSGYSYKNIRKIEIELE